MKKVARQVGPTIAAVVTMVTLGDGATRSVQAQVASLGGDLSGGHAGLFAQVRQRLALRALPSPKPSFFASGVPEYPEGIRQPP